MRRRSIVIGATVGLLLATATVATAAATSTPVSCSITDSTLSCPLPQAAPTTVTKTVTKTKTVTAQPSSSSAVSSSSAAPSSSAPSSPTDPPSTSAAPTTSAPTTSSPTTAPPSPGCASAANTTGGADPWGGCFPGPDNTGIPAGTALTPYAGPCDITTANTVIDANTVNCDLTIEASGVRITRSKINGIVSVDSNSTGYSMTISDSEVDAGNVFRSGIGDINFTATRVEVIGGNRSIMCFKDCTVQDSYVHGQLH